MVCSFCGTWLKVSSSSLPSTGHLLHLLRETPRAWEFPQLLRVPRLGQLGQLPPPSFLGHTTKLLLPVSSLGVCSVPCNAQVTLLHCREDLSPGQLETACSLSPCSQSRSASSAFLSPTPVSRNSARFRTERPRLWLKRDQQLFWVSSTVGGA